MRSGMNYRLGRAFTLIEILIVVVILSILAALVVPQFTSASQDTMDTSIHTTLYRVRGQIELYKFHNPGVVLTAANLFPTLVADNYLQQSPRNPLQPVATSTAVGAAPAADVGWVWADTNGDGIGDDFSATDGTGGAFVE